MPRVGASELGCERVSKPRFSPYSAPWLTYVTQVCHRLRERLRWRPTVALIDRPITPSNEASARCAGRLPSFRLSATCRAKGGSLATHHLSLVTKVAFSNAAAPRSGPAENPRLPTRPYPDSKRHEAMPSNAE
jgi:hypothetical protein